MQSVPTHRPPGAADSLETTRRHYDRRQRNRASKAFYGSPAWERIRLIKLAADPACEDCLTRDQLTPAGVVHHIIEITDDPSRRLDLGNLRSLCKSCHSRLHACK